ncbi:nitroreductase/quinone reductase family protein [Luteipulveratus mongoliensis]|uniref:nitroreductase/quinone reductase family protein n=1 Tax=Luteipulveratus mongoliensis TaxID=571913 RepID=UPI0006970D7A|nr:nitroreductase/quinone reductase family protein [Luteipulveratus mongoliensis]
MADAAGTIPAVLPVTGTVDLQTTGRRTGHQRWVEIWFVYVDGQLVVTGTPGARNWLANLRSTPEARVRFRDPLREVAVVARLVKDPAERRRLVPLIWEAQPWYAEQPFSMEDWVADAPLVVLTGTDHG